MFERMRQEQAARVRETWSGRLPEPGPEEFARRLVAFLEAYLVFALAMTVVVVLALVGGFAGLLSAPVRLAIVLVVAIPLAWRTRQAFVAARHTAAAQLDLTAAEERRLRITNPAMLERSLGQIRQARGGA
ncbi:MAG: hypothetical protein KQH57_13335 [Actinomycetales bacterium]|nr:hypothetical protein [Actinomycetales bacterium]